MFELGICRDDPHKLLEMPIGEILYWYDLGLKWRELKNKANK